MHELKTFIRSQSHWIILCLFVVHAIAGCSGSQQVFHANIVGGKEARTTFTWNEAVQLSLNGYAGHAVEFRVAAVSTGRKVYHETHNVPSTWTGIVVTVGRLPRDSYYAVALVDSRVVGSWNFTVE